MNRERVLVAAFVLGAGFLLTATVSAATQQSIPELIEVARSQTQDTAATVHFANNLMLPRIAGLGIGLAVGLTVGSVVAFTTWGER